jgi:uncharacterized membrane protein
MRIIVWITLLAIVLLVALFPLVFGQIMTASLIKLHLSEGTAVWLVVAIIVGGFINFSVKQVKRAEAMEVPPFVFFGRPWLRPPNEPRETIIAVNLGGCLIPTGLAVYELFELGRIAPELLLSSAIAAGISVAVCYRLAVCVPGVGIGLPGLIPPLVSACLSILLAPEQAPPVAFIAGVFGPLIGADVLHLKDVEVSGARIASIGGAGTFDGIVLAGIIAAYLA